MEQTRKQMCKSEADAQSAALMLLEDYIKKNAKEVATSISPLIPFFDDCCYSVLQDCVSTVNSTFATIALEVIEDFNLKESSDPDRRLLPCSASDLKGAIYYLNKLVDSLYRFSIVFDKRGVPAIDMCCDAFAKDEIIG